jgi:hypothetical protein
MAATKAQIAALYVGYFNRGADPEGLNYWLGQTQMSVVEIANSFAVQPEAKATYAYLAAPEPAVHPGDRRVHHRSLPERLRARAGRGWPPVLAQ